MSAPTTRQAEILDRAFELLAEGGLAGLTLRKVAERVGFTEAAIYRHFPNKQALVFALVDALGARLLGRIGVVAHDRTLPPAARLERMVRHHVRILRETRGLPVVLVAEGLASADAALIERLGRVLRTYVGLLAAVLAELDLPIGIPPERQATMFFGLPAALAIQLRAFPDLALDDDEVERLVHFYVRSLTRAGELPEVAP